MKPMNQWKQDFLNKSMSEVGIPEFRSQIKPDNSLYFAGSCFASQLHSFWQDHFLPGRTAPFGNIYNPESLRAAFELLLSGRKLDESELFFHQDLWRHSLFDTLKSSPHKKILLRNLNRALGTHREYLKGCRFMVITVGTAWVYRDKKTGMVVNNCHKRPGSDFERVCMTSDKIGESLSSFCRIVSNSLPDITFIMTLSPVRHLRDSATENSLSKALLRCGLNDLCKQQENTEYFPSYEIMMDELRDYRWYAEDLSHPSPRASHYIMHRFCGAAGTEELQKYLPLAEKLKNMMDHRLRFPDSTQGIKFKEKLNRDLEGFRKVFPFADLPDPDSSS
ncbi:MAG: hypothetical protein B6241_05890 [Spirochaetaceae bacterium 4572_59]|nr:MAG: hypothetical protein B6241_05890 [Spirochaetaceae bacterium 4572_59]